MTPFNHFKNITIYLCTVVTYTFILLPFLCVGQDTVVTTEGETHEGQVTIDLPNPGYESIVLKNNNGKKKWRAHEIIAITKDDEKYVPVKYGPKYRLMKVGSDGYLSLYYFRFEKSYDFGSRYLYKKDGVGLEVPNFGFKRIIANYLSDCPAVADEVIAGGYKKNELDKIITDYNLCVDKNTLKSKLQLAEVVDVSNPALATLEVLRSKIGKGNEELNTLLTDIQTKIVQDKPIPNYLAAALKEQTADLKEVQAEVSNLLKQLAERD